MKMSWVEKLIVNSCLFELWRIWSMQRVLNQVRNTKGPVLEVGCGKGTTTVQIAKRLPKAKIVGIEFDPAQVKLARQRIKSRRIKILQGDASKLSFKDSSFNAVFAFLTFHHIGRWRQALYEAYRVLKSDGDFYIDDLALKPFPKFKHWFLPTDGIFSRKEFFAELEKAGFKIANHSDGYKFWVHARK